VLDSKPDILRDDRTSSVVNQSPYFDERLPTITSQTSASSSPTSSPNAQSANGLTAEYFDNSDLTNSVLKRVDSAVDFNWGEGSPDASIGADTFSVRWTGQVRSKYSEAYTFHTVSDDGVRLWVNGQLLIDHWTDHAPTEDTGTISLTADQNYDLKLEYYERGGGATARLFWSSPTQAQEIVPQSQLFSLPPLEQTVSGQALTQLPGEQARSASSFIDSLGIDTHLRYTDTSYGRFGDVVEPRLQELGIHHIRDGGNNPALFDKLNQLAASGIRSTLVMDPQDGISPTDAVNIVKQVAASAEAVEGPNEWDVHPDRAYKGDFFPNGVRQYQTELYQALKSDPTTASVSVIAPSMAMPEHASQIGSLHDVTDMGNMHSYAGGNAPTTDYDWRWMPLTKSISGDRPIVVTETGWHTATNSASSQKGVSEQVAAKYIPRQYLENFNWGIQRTFMYELMDEKPEATQENSFGLIRYDGSPKPAFYAVKNLVSLLNDTSSRSTLGTLNFSLTGDTTNLHHTLLQKTNGDYFLVLWSNATSTDASLSQSVTLNLSTPISQATTFLSNRSTDATGQYNAPTQLALNVMDEPLIVKLTPA
jgi:hypothetical protein